MAASMAHRGPDGISAWADGPVGLAHCAMHTTPEAEHERQPLADPLSGCVITADARIDNREELLRILRPTPSDGEVITDVDLILAAYLRWGTSAPEHLVGDFAFAVWDPREQHLFCTRDHIGIKPFYYHLDGKTLYFGSEIKAIRSVAGPGFDINEERVAEFIAKQAISPDSTFFVNIYRLPSSHSLVVRTDGRHDIKRYWALDPDKETAFATDEDEWFLRHHALRWLSLSVRCMHGKRHQAIDRYRTRQHPHRPFWVRRRRRVCIQLGTG